LRPTFFDRQVQYQHAESVSRSWHTDHAVWNEAGDCRLFNIFQKARITSFQAGLITGSVTLVLLSYVSVNCMLMVVQCKNSILQDTRRTAFGADELSFGGLANELLGPRGKFWADFCVVFTQLAFGTAYIIYAGSNCNIVASTYGFSFSVMGISSEIVLVAFAGLLISPVVLLRCIVAHASVFCFS
jgi:amino acid permease